MDIPGKAMGRERDDRSRLADQKPLTDTRKEATVCAIAFIGYLMV